MDKVCTPCMVMQTFSSPNRCKMLQTDYNDFLTECANSALSAVEHHEKMMKYADEQIAYWRQYREREQTAWNNAYINYCDWLKKQGKEPEKVRPRWKNIVVVNEVKQ